MKKNMPIINRLLSELLSAGLLLLMLLSLTLNPIAATVKNTAVAPPVSAAESNPAATRTVPPQTESAMLAPTATFTNATTISIPDNPTVGSPYPSQIAVSGMVGTVTSVSVTLNGFTAPRPSNLDFLLVGPGGQSLIILSDAGANLTAVGPITFTLADSGAANVPANPTNPSGATTYKPTDYDATDPNFPAPAPAGPYNRPVTTGTANTATFASVYNGLSGAAVNGNWSLYAFDDAGGGGASSLAGGWTIDITTAALTSTTTTVLSSANPSLRQNAVTFTANITPSVGNTGTVTFTDGATPICSNVPVVSSSAQCVAAANSLSEGTHLITATYSGGGSFAGSNGSINQEVNNQTVIVGNNFTNPGTITIADNAGGAEGATPYPSKIFVSGLSGTISKVTLTLTNLNTPRTNDVDFLLVGPNGDNYVFMSDVGGAVATSGANITLDDAAGSQLPNSGALSTGTFRPTDFAADSAFPAPAPAGPYNSAPTNGVATFNSVYGGDAPNGTWSLYVDDDAGGGGVSTIGSWTLTITTAGGSPTTTVLTSSPNPSNVNQAVTFTATVTSAGNPVTTGTVNFRIGATPLCSNVALNGSGQATCSPVASTFNTQGSFVVSADYSGTASFGISSGNVTQVVNSPTVVTCLNFANNGGITVSNATQVGSPYPSNIIVSGLAGTISKVTLTMTIGSALTPDHNDFLLVGPGGQKFHFMGDAGGTIDIINQTITLDDAAATALPDATAITTGTYRPASYGADADSFPAPAPVGPYNPAAPDGAGTFALYNGISPNGTWQLYAVEDAGDAADTIITNWSLNFTLAAVNTTTTVTSSANPSVFGQPVTFTATVSSAAGVPTGNVQFFDGATPIGGAVALNGSGIAQVTTSSLSVGNHTISASYAGATNACIGTFNGSSGNLTGNPQVVNKANTTTTLTSNQSNPVGTSVPVTFTATVTPQAPSAVAVGANGTVTFSRNGSPICSNVALNASSQATCTLTFTLAGNYNITAVYSGTTNYNASTSSVFVQQVVGPTAADVNVEGRIMSSDGRGVYNARVVMSDSNGQTRYVLTNPFGYYRFAGVPSGAIYTFTVAAKGYVTQEGIVRNVSESITDLNVTLERPE